ncbi:hypothetical protein U27_01392 [Candidatus Vecturithrix granuli]|uniref:AAA+ ATPase domain-containing protein n=1 Tax=Vecturithrix granuli TaxID=1499967 RepID=A0A081CA86_VECG1|nr:hypothetical protein U27_01392 [Candidatus Vecturithrix granuli]
MRRFSSYGPLDTDLHYYAPREELIAKTYTELVGDDPDKGGHYITVWAPRQTGKTWVMQQIVRKLRADERFEAAILTMQSAKTETTPEGVLEVLVTNLKKWFQRDFPEIRTWKSLSSLFAAPYFTKPLILILDEFDAMGEEFINAFANEFRSMYTERLNERDKPDGEKSCLLHGLALIGVRTVLGIENVSGLPFNVQRSVHIPNLSCQEVEGLFRWHARESSHPVEQDVIDRLYYETGGHPGLTCWFGELLTEGCEDYQPPTSRPISMEDFEHVFLWAAKGLPNNTILNIISKAKQEPYKDVVLQLFRTERKLEFRYDEALLNYLYMNGVVGVERDGSELHVKFASPFVQKRLFNYFSIEIFQYIGKVRDITDPAADVISGSRLHIPALMKRFETYLQQNRDWLLKDAPKRKDLRIYEAVYHFCFYRYLYDFLGTKHAKVYPEFPTGNGKIDLIITYYDATYGLELKSYTTESEYDEALEQAAKYGKQMRLPEIWLIAFVEYVDDATRQKYEVEYVDQKTGVRVMPLFVETGR